jgi:hypothetical protein
MTYSLSDCRSFAFCVSGGKFSLEMRFVQGLKPIALFWLFSARLKPCPVTKP